MKADEYVKILDDNYCNRYLREGGSAFKIVVIDSHSVARSFEAAVHERCDHDGASLLSLRSSEQKLHLMDRLFCGLARSIDWDQETFSFMQRHVLPTNSRSGKCGGIEIGRDAASRESVLSAIKQCVSHDYGYCAEFRVALTHLCLATLTINAQPLPGYGDLVKQWLRGELASITPLKPALIFRKLQRGSARHMLYSTLRFLRQCGHSYVVLLLDISRYMETVAKADRREGFYYTPAATVELYELLRQSIDDLEQFDGTMMIVTVPQAFALDERRGIGKYPALKMRLWNDFRVKNAQNPLAPMIWL